MSVKKLGTLILLLVSATCWGETLVLPEKARAISFVGKGEIHSVKMDIPHYALGVTCKSYSTLNLRLFLEGCEDELGPVRFHLKYNPKTRKYDLFVAAINIHMVDSETSECEKPKVAFKKISFQPYLDPSKINLILSDS